ncbi:MAG: hypothetical protein M1828_007548 [Chrysothrix sp. TS-e1954]|nr:MAG: hypothetical protein M1828_007548 [Chrysothrix sp. TS-e1954]
MSLEDDPATVRPLASYQSPTSSETITGVHLPKQASDSPKQRAQQLLSLKKSCQGMQREINAMLTQKMEEDKASSTTQAVNEKKEEENYGEEADEDE